MSEGMGAEEPHSAIEESTRPVDAPFSRDRAGRILSAYEGGLPVNSRTHALASGILVAPPPTGAHHMPKPAELPSIPGTVDEKTELVARHGLAYVALIDVDHKTKTINPYLRTLPPMMESSARKPCRSYYAEEIHGIPFAP